MNDKLQGNGIGRVILYCYLALVVFLPNILKAKSVYYVSPALEPENMQTGNYINLFTQYKFSFLIFSFIAINILFLWYLTQKNTINIGIYDYIIASFLLILSLSFYFSDYKSVAFLGKYNRSDGTLFFIIIFILMFIISKLKISDKFLDILSYSLVPFITINTVVAYLFIKRYPLLNSDFYKKYILGSEVTNSSGYISSTLENPNYLSGFAGFLAIYFITRFILLKKISFIDGITSILSLFLLISSFSTSGIFSLAISFLFLVVFFEKIDIYGFLKMVILIPFIYLGMNKIKSTDPIVNNEINKIANLINNNIVLVIFTILVILIAIYFVKKKTYYTEYKIHINVFFIVLILAGFFILPYSEYYKQTYPDKLYTAEEINQIVENKEVKSDFLSNRAFPWVNTIDLIKDKPIFGYGLGTFAFEYNSRNIFIPTSKWTPNTLFDKPHNSYLEIAYGAGIFALILFILIFVNLFFQGLEKLRDNFDPRNLSLLLGMIAFLIQALVNDSNVGSYPVMFIFFGVLISRLNNDEEVVEEIDNGKKKPKHK